MGTWRRMAYPRQNSLRGDRRETPSEDSRRSRPAVYRSCRPKGGMNDKRFAYGLWRFRSTFLSNRDKQS